MQLALMLASAIVLARLLPPRDFGLFAMVVSLTAIVGSLRGFGLHFAAMQARDLSPEEAGALFRVNLRLTALSAVFVAAMAPVLAWFYGQESLVALTAAAAVGIFAHGAIILHEALLMRDMRFGVLQGSELGAQLAGFAAAVAAALGGLGVWALVLNPIVHAIVKASVVLWASRWVPIRAPRPDGLSRLLVFGRDFTTFHVLSNAGRRLDRILMGYFHSATVLGYYDNAFRWSHHPIHQLFPPLMRVAVAGLSRLQDDARAYATAARRALLPLFSLVVPALAWLALEAHVMIPNVLGEQWMGAVPFFRILAVGAIAGGIRQATHWLYLSMGDTRRQVHWSALSLPVLWLGAIVGIAWGPMGVAVGYTAAAWALAYPGVAFCLRSSPLDVSTFVATFARPAAASAAAGASHVAAVSAGGAGFVLRGLVFGVVYVAVWRILPGGRRGWEDLLRIAREIPDILRRRPAVTAAELT